MLRFFAENDRPYWRAREIGVRQIQEIPGNHQCGTRFAQESLRTPQGRTLTAVMSHFLLHELEAIPHLVSQVYFAAFVY